MTEEPAEPGPPPEVRVRSVSRRRFVQELQAREHRWLADRPRGEEGDGLGPTPLEVLLGSFAAQTGMGVIDLAREKEWAVDSVEVELVQSGLPPNDAPGSLTRALRIRGELNESERRELEAEVAARWPRAVWLPPGDLRDSFLYE